MLNVTFKTNMQMQLANQHTRAFKGKYTMTIYHKGQVTETKHFTLGQNGATVNVNVTSNGE